MDSEGIVWALIQRGSVLAEETEMKKQICFLKGPYPMKMREKRFDGKYR